MKLYMKTAVTEALLPDLRKIHSTLGQTEDRRGNSKPTSEVDLSTLTRNEVEQLKDLFELSTVRGTKVLAQDVAKYLKAADDGVDGIQARTCRQAAWMLEHYFAQLPNHIIFSQDDYEGRSHTGYYVADVDYEPYKEGTSYSTRQQEHATFDVVWIENDTRHSREVRLYPSDCIGLTCKEMLAARGFVPETDELIEKLADETVLFYQTIAEVGTQYRATGIGLVDLDDASTTKRDRWMRERVRMNNFGIESTVVVDVLYETDSEKKERSGGGAEVNLYRWHEWNLRFFSPSEDVLVRHMKADEDSAERPLLQIPVHPLVPCFDLKRHLRLRVHVNNLTRYEYRRAVAEGLVLPEVDRKMIDILIDQSQNTFQDIVGGKGQSMNILSSGPPGTGKTATAEVFAEFKGRPLYTVQCSQLGLDPEDVEKSLSIVLMRANRWNAVLLLDEADVYIRRRAADIQQNAIVGVFLRVLEYASCILFMTTNLPENVDDAVASRCIVHLHYGVPSPSDQAHIWKILADLNGLALENSTINDFVVKHPQLTGRDVKNLLKLASFISEADKTPITYATLELALRFKPTLTEA